MQSGDGNRGARSAQTVDIAAEDPLPIARVRDACSGHISSLDGLRAISAFFVVAYHFGFEYVPAGFGVLVFFVISGFVITTLLLREQDRNGTISLRRFYARRTLRILPAFYVYWVLVTVLWWPNGRLPWAQALSALLFASNYYQGLHGYPEGVYSHLWSVAVEAQFYLLWPALFLLFGGTRKRLFVSAVAAIAAIWICRVALHAAAVPAAYIYTALETRMDHPLVGCALAIAVHEKYFGRFWTSVTHPGRYVVTLLLLSASVVVGNYQGVGYRNLVGFALDPLLIAILIVQLIARQTIVTAVLNSKPMVFLGTISYSTYLYQQVVLFPTREALQSMGAPLAIAFTGSVTAVLAVASLSYLFVEAPLLSMRRGFSAGAR